MNVTVIGADTLVGRQIVDTIQRDHFVVPVGRADLDLCNTNQIYPLICRLDPEVVINAESFAGVEECARNPFKAVQINAAAPAAMAEACRKRNALLIHLSTSYVCYGDTMGLCESSPTKPTSVLGRTRLWGEEAVSMCGGPHYILRLSSVYGREYTRLLEPVMQVSEGRGSFSNPAMVLHQFCSPTSTTLVAEMIRHILSTERGPSGVYNLASRTGAWRADFAKYLLQHVCGQGPEGPWIIRDKKADLSRPVHCHLKVSKFEETFGVNLPTWQEDLSRILPLLPAVEASAKVA